MALRLRPPAITPATATPLKGVNLGGWLVLEKWLTPSVFADALASDEYTLCSLRSRAAYKRIRDHRDTFITEADFAWLARHGVEAVRLPVGYWVFGDEKPYLGTIKYVDKVFLWAKKYNLRVLLCLHGAPGSQNGWDHSGRAGEVKWGATKQSIQQTVAVIEKLAVRYAKQTQLLGIELLNEPRPLLAKSLLRRYYQAAYRVVRQHCGPDVWVVIHDNFRPSRWAFELRGKQYQNVLVDTHRYQCHSARDKRHGIAWHLKRTTQVLPRTLARIARTHPLIVGEWSLALDARTTGRLNKRQADSLNRAFAGAQLLAYSHARAWFYWTYKTEHSPTWSYREAVQRGWLP